MTALLEVDGREVLTAPGEVRRVGPQVVRAVSDRRVCSVRLAGRDLTAAGRAARAAAGLAVLGRVAVAPEVSVRDHLLAVPGVRRSAADALLTGADLLAGRGDDPAGWLSGGERQVLGWLRVEALGPRVVVLDAAGRGLDDQVLEWASARLSAWRAAGVAVAVHPGRPEEESWIDQAPAR